MFQGGVNEVVREGDRVGRPAGPWSPTVQRLLGHLRDAGFTGAPRPYGFGERGGNGADGGADGDRAGGGAGGDGGAGAAAGNGVAGGDGVREFVEFLPGEVGHDFSAPYCRSDPSLAAMGRLLRAFHDATAGFPRRPDDVWHLPPREPAEVICHGDAATYNTVFREGLPVALIDFDTAHPAPRVWDAAYTAYRFVPLYAPDETALTLPVADALRRLRLFADAYGLTDGQRAELPAVAAERLRTLVAHMRAQAAAGHPAFARHLAEGHHRRYLTDARWIEENFTGRL